MSAFEISAIASGLVTKPDAVQRATLLHCLGPAVQRIFNTLPGEHEKYDDVKASLNSYFAPKMKVVAERYKFRSQAQRRDELINTNCEVIYETFHTLNCGFEIKWAMIIAVVDAI